MDRGVFVFEGLFESINCIKTEAGKWRMFKAVYEYEVSGILPDEKTQNSGIFRLAKAVIDGKKEKKANKKSAQIEEAKLNENQTKIDTRNIFENPLDGGEVAQKSDSGTPCSPIQKVIPTRARVRYNKKDNKKDNEKNNFSSSFVSGEGDGSKSVTSAEVPVTAGVPPEEEEVREFVNKVGVNVSPKAFCGYYSAKNWKIRGEPIDDWRALVLAWERKEKFLRDNNIKFRNENMEVLDALFDNIDDVEF